jgi:hypothetical protein|tara:strand:+ start:192 stop:305 length:114 start_codon:yes stop_codon:yes gene_type:complete
MKKKLNEHAKDYAWGIKNISKVANQAPKSWGKKGNKK